MSPLTLSLTMPSLFRSDRSSVHLGRLCLHALVAVPGDVLPAGIRTSARHEHEEELVDCEPGAVSERRTLCAYMPAIIRVGTDIMVWSAGRQMALGGARAGCRLIHF